MHFFLNQVNILTFDFQFSRGFLQFWLHPIDGLQARLGTLGHILWIGHVRQLTTLRKTSHHRLRFLPKRAHSSKSQIPFSKIKKGKKRFSIWWAQQSPQPTHRNQFCNRARNDKNNTTTFALQRTQTKINTDNNKKRKERTNNKMCIHPRKKTLFEQ